MKKTNNVLRIALFILTIHCSLFTAFTAHAQAPQSFNYQAVARDNFGTIIANKAVSLRISLLQGTTTGTSVYCETHAVTTDNTGIINLAIGGGTVSSGTFATIDWSTGIYFVKVELDATGGSTYALVGTSQLLSVPYAMYALKSGTSVGSSGVPQYTQAQIDALTPTAGMLVYNTDYNILQFYNGSQWSGSSQASVCVPQANNAIAPNHTGSMTTTLTLQGSKPAVGINGKWSILSGSGGSFSDDTKYNSTFSGVNDSVYALRWSLRSKCDTTHIDVTVSIGLQTVNFNGTTLYVSPMDNGSAIWSTAQSLTNATSTTDGKTNTAAIVSVIGTNGGVAYAAKVCDTLTLGGFTDWYLPSKDELNAIYLNQASVGGFSPGSYWSSTESDFYSAWYRVFPDSGQGSETKNYNGFQVRCVRKP